MASRATWKGTLKISLVTIPIAVYPATEASESLSFNQLHAGCQHRITQRRWCVACDREVTTKEIVKGYEFEPGKYVILLPEELDAVQPPSAKVIDLVAFAPVAALPLRSIDRAYYLAPDGSEDSAASRAHALLIVALHGKVGIGTLAIYGREYLVAVSPAGQSLMLYTLHHAAEQRAAPMAASLETLATFYVGSPELALARQVIAALTGPLTLADFQDAYRADLRRLIAAKIAGQEIVEPVPVDTPPVVALAEALKQSLAAVTPTKPPAAGKRKRKAA